MMQASGFSKIRILLPKTSTTMASKRCKRLFDGPRQPEIVLPLKSQSGFHCFDRSPKMFALEA